MEKKELSVQESMAINAINSLSSASVRITKLAKIFVELTGKPPTIAELIDISYSFQKRPQKVAEVATRLLGHNAHDRPQTLARLNGRIGEMGRLLTSYSEKKYRRHMETHLSVKSDGTVYLSDKAARKIKSGN